MITAELVAELLNSMMEADPTATHALVINRMPCNAALTAHPHVIVDQLGDDGRDVVGLLGVLNGLLSSAGTGRAIAMKWEDSEVGSGRMRLVGFVARDQIPPDLAPAPSAAQLEILDARRRQREILDALVADTWTLERREMTTAEVEEFNSLDERITAIEGDSGVRSRTPTGGETR